MARTSTWIVLVLVAQNVNAAALPSYLDFCLRRASERNGFYSDVGFAINTGSEALRLVANVEYQQSLTDSFTLVWSPLPLGVHYRVDTSESFQSAVMWNLGLIDEGQLGLKPQFDSFSRKPINRSVALEFNLEYGTFIPFNSKPEAWMLSAAMGERFLVLPRLSLVADVEVALQTEKAFSARFPLILALDFIASKNAKVGLDYQYRGLLQEGRDDIADAYVNVGW